MIEILQITGIFLLVAIILMGIFIKAIKKIVAEEGKWWKERRKKGENK
jgi:formate hydrogenlyase subunit 3/multisubunit Na+/H+ antiporter MnhD subunit